MKKYKVKIKGVTPYMQHRMDDIKLEKWEKNRKRIIERDDVDKEDAVRAEYHCYRNSDDELFIPAEQIRGSLINAGTMHKAKVGNSRKSMKNIVAAMFFIDQDEVLITPQEYTIDKRSAVNRNIKARVIVIRPKWKQWETEFVLNVDNDTITDETIRNIIEDAGNYIGIGSFRPTNNGMFGRFSVEEFEKIDT